jgi:hypothetical protein
LYDILGNEIRQEGSNITNEDCALIFLPNRNRRKNRSKESKKSLMKKSRSLYLLNSKSY